MKTLRGRLLVATPDLQNEFFRRALILVCEHDAENGAIGFIVNHPSDITLRDLLLDMKIKPEDPEALGRPVFLGGPVRPNLGFGLYTGGRELSDSAKIDGRIRVTASRALLERCAVGKGPKNLLVAMGYSGWFPGQLEREMDIGSWWLAEPSPELLFGTPWERRWGEALKQLGLDESSLYFGRGHA